MSDQFIPQYWKYTNVVPKSDSQPGKDEFFGVGDFWVNFLTSDDIPIGHQVYICVDSTPDALKWDYESGVDSGKPFNY